MKGSSLKAMIKFYKVNEEYGCFSNFSKHGFELNEKYWETSEHFFQAQKFVGSEHEEEIRLAKTPMVAAKMGRDRTRPLRENWEEVKDEIMRIAVLQKFKSIEDIRDILLSTGEEEIVENTSNDYYWGCGKDGTGRNMLGKILMETREILRKNQ